MTNLSNQPFLLSLEEAVKQTDSSEGYEILLQEQNSHFKKQVYECIHSGFPAPKRFYSLKKADYELHSIRQKYADSIRENNLAFHRFWTMMIDDTRRFIDLGIETLKFQAKCPSHMLTETEHTHSFPPCNWTAHRSDLMELIVGVYQADVIKFQDGSRPSFALFAKEIGEVFGITFSNPHDEMRRILNRKKSQTPFFNSIIACLKGKSKKMDE
jgi:hypothetical protein